MTNYAISSYFHEKLCQIMIHFSMNSFIFLWTLKFHFIFSWTRACIVILPLCHLILYFSFHVCHIPCSWHVFVFFTKILMCLFSLYKYVYYYSTLLFRSVFCLVNIFFFLLHNLLSQSQMETKGVLTLLESAVSIFPVRSFTITITYAPY